MMNAPKTTSVSATVSPILSWVKTLWEIKKPVVVKSGSDITGTVATKPTAVKTGSQTTGFFLGIWTTIKTWFTNLTASTSTPTVVTTGSISSGAVVLTGSTGETLSGFTDAIVEDTGSTVVSESTGTQTITGTTVKKPTTKKTTTHTSNSDRDPVLDALF